MNSLLTSLFRSADSVTFCDFAAHLWSRLALGLWVGWAGILGYVVTVALRSR